MPKDEIEALKQKFVEQLSPVGIYLFGSFASSIIFIIAVKS